MHPSISSQLHSPLYLQMEVFQGMKISCNPDGTVDRQVSIPDLPATPAERDPSNPMAVLSKDIPLNRSVGTSLRLFLPTAPSVPTKLPVFVFIHGGGFILLSPASSINHTFCENIASSLPALVVSLKYSLAPEHRLPTAYLDAADTLSFLGSADSDPWLANRADLSRCFLFGCSAGGNIVYHTALWARGQDLGPARIRGLILNNPFFGGEERTESELRLGGEQSMLSLSATDLMWELALPEGANRDHEYSNVAAKAEKLDGLPRCLVTGFTNDLLVDRMREVAKMLRRGGVDVSLKIEDGGFHCADFIEQAKQSTLIETIREFVNSSVAIPAL